MIENFYEHNEVKKLNFKYDNPNSEKLGGMQHPFYCLLTSGSKGGKSNILLNIIAIASQKKGTWGHIYVIHKLDEPLYEFLKNKVGGENITFFKDIKEFPTAQNLEITSQSLVVFDDQISDKKAMPRILEYFSMGRKIGGFGCSIVCLSQGYFGIPKSIRLNCNFQIFLKMNNARDIREILQDISCMECNKLELKKIFEDATHNYNFLKVEIKNPNPNKIYSKNFTDFYKIV